MSAPVSSLKFAKIGIVAYSGTHYAPEDIKNSEVVVFIKERGKDTRKYIQDQLETVRPIVSKMKSLVAKGQILGIKIIPNVKMPVTCSNGLSIKLRRFLQLSERQV